MCRMAVIRRSLALLLFVGLLIPIQACINVLDQMSSYPWNKTDKMYLRASGKGVAYDRKVFYAKKVKTFDENYLHFTKEEWERAVFDVDHSQSVVQTILGNYDNDEFRAPKNFFNCSYVIFKFSHIIRITQENHEQISSVTIMEGLVTGYIAFFLEDSRTIIMLPTPKITINTWKDYLKSTP